MTIYDKIKCRVELLWEGLPNVIRAILYEPKKNPWFLFFARLLLSTEKFSSVLPKHIKSFIKPINNDNSKVLADFGIVKIVVESNNEALFVLAWEYLALIYPYRAKFPIWEITGEGPYEYGPVSLMPGDVVIDAGANLGLFSIFAAKKIGKSGTVYAFEPVKKICNFLQESIDINNVSDNVPIIQSALGDKNGNLTLSCGDIGSSSGVIHRSDKEIIVSQMTLDDFIFQKKLNKVDFIKMDIEGMERNALKGAQKTIAKFKPKLAICTYHLPDDPQVLPQIIQEAAPDYKIIQKKRKLYAYYPNNSKPSKN